MGELVHDRPELLAELGELVHGRRGRRRELATADDSASLEVLQADGEDVRPAAGEVAVQIRVAKGPVLEQLANDEERPPLPDEVERMGDRAVVVVGLRHDG